MEDAEDSVDWLELPDHLYFEIMGKLICFFDYARFGAVCVKWRSLIFNENEEEDCRPILPPQPPLLLVPKPAATSTTSRSCSFYRITDKKVVCPHVQLKMPHERQFRGSGHGWLVTVDDDKASNYPVQLINPFFLPDPIVIPLPPLTAFQSKLDEDETVFDPICNADFLRKAVLSANPISNPKDYMVTVIWGTYRRLAFFKPGDKAWTLIDYDNSFVGLFEDVIHYHGKVYAVRRCGSLTICDIEKCMAMKIVDSPMKILRPDRKYLVESSGNLLQVYRRVNSIKYPTYSTIKFKVFKLCLDQMGLRKADWEEVKDLCGCALFLGYNVSISISASDFPGCKPNCIYYTDDDDDDASNVFVDSGHHDMGVFNLEDGSTDKHYPTNIQDSIWPNPIWIEPRLPLKKQSS